LLEVRKTPVVLNIGTVTSAPAGINCGLLCTEDSATFASGTVVTLTANALLTSQFSNWSGDCTGTATTCVVTMDADKLVFAHFTLLRPSADPATDSVAGPLLRSRLLVPGGRGDVTVDGRTLSVAGGVETAVSLAPRSGEIVVEGWVREGAGEGVWRFSLGPPEGGLRIQRVLAGEPVTFTPDTVVFRLKGRAPRRIAFVVRREPESAGVLLDR
jgi:hypothetical protein